MGDRVVQPDVVEERCARADLAVDREPAALGEPLDEQKAADAVALHRAVDLAARRAQLGEAATLELALDQLVGDRGHVQSPSRASASASQTRSTCPSSIWGKNGSASSRAEASSATGNWPS